MMRLEVRLLVYRLIFVSGLSRCSLWISSSQTLPRTMIFVGFNGYGCYCIGEDRFANFMKIVSQLF
ncbi:hypothetical protein Hdeb2414_s0410g00887981 [Helianthus debilis subsp. tardiflorus]